MFEEMDAMKQLYANLTNIPPGHARIMALDIICVDLFRCKWDDLIKCIMRERDVLRGQAINLAHRWIEDKIEYRRKMGWQEYRQGVIRRRLKMNRQNLI